GRRACAGSPRCVNRGGTCSHRRGGGTHRPHQKCPTSAPMPGMELRRAQAADRTGPLCGGTSEMRSLIALIAAVVTLVSAAAQATPSRAVALGGLGLYVEDDTNVLRYPGLLSKYSHFVFIDLGGNSGLQPALTG